MSRLDVYLTESGLFSTRSKAQQAIREGLIRVNGRTATKSGMEVSEQDRIEYEQPDLTFVSRGGYKLLEAIRHNGIDLKDRTVLDIGASTGGFTDCALQHGAMRVYACDVGHDQLDPSLRNNERVISREGINCRNLTSGDFPEKIDFICMDVSFISCIKMLGTIENVLKEGGEAVILFKPQFEVGPQHLNGHGIVTDDRITREKLEETVELINGSGLSVISVIESPIRGTDGNREYLIYLRKNDNQAL
ncbi:MAG: TlyA family RNA methyltransferase [Erysipelotrichaceae bacterium]|nr:TlyA family RNA methyltransferase [Erysipelotrichaceae bacterium]